MWIAYAYAYALGTLGSRVRQCPGLGRMTRAVRRFAAPYEYGICRWAAGVTCAGGQPAWGTVASAEVGPVLS